MSDDEVQLPGGSRVPKGHNGTPETLSLAALDQRLAALRLPETSASDPIRLALIEAMIRRAHSHQGEAQQLILSRAQELIVDYEDRLAKRAAHPTSPDVRPALAHSALSALLDSLNARSAGETENTVQSPQTMPSREPVRELRTLARFRSTWSALNAEQKLKHALARAPRQAGPLNSHQLVHRCLALMQEVSPVYLQQLISTIEALSWASQQQLGANTVEPPTRPHGARSKMSSRASR